MSAPKSVVKIKKDGVEYTSNVDACNYYIFELSRAALRDVGKFIKKRWREAYYSKFKKHTNEGGKATTFEVVSSKSTKYPRVRIGLPHSHRGHPVRGFYSYFQEFGTSKTPRYELLRRTVEENISEIVRIESQYLSGLSDEAERLNELINEDDILDDEE